MEQQNNTNTITYKKDSEFVYTTSDSNKFQDPNELRGVAFKNVKQVNKNYDSIPMFYINEMRYAKVGAIFWTIFSILALGGLSYLAYYIVKVSGSEWWLVFFLLPILAFLLGLIYYFNSWNNRIRKEAMTIDFSHEKILTNNVRKMYLKLKLGYLDANWLCSLIYVFGTIVILVTLLTVFILNIWEKGHAGHYFGELVLTDNPNNKLPTILVGTSGAVLIGTLILHIFWLISFSMRKNKIEDYYNVPIFSLEELAIESKKRNRRNLVIFLLCTLTIIAAAFFIYRVITRNKRK